jgi:hypothetical protein
MKSLPSPKKVVQGIARATSFRRKTLQQQPKTLPTTDPTTESPAINDQEEAQHGVATREKPAQPHAGCSRDC